jgi:hypothetical protein
MDVAVTSLLDGCPPDCGHFEDGSYETVIVDDEGNRTVCFCADCEHSEVCGLRDGFPCT